MLRSPKYANMGHWPNLYITKEWVLNNVPISLKTLPTLVNLGARASRPLRFKYLQSGRDVRAPGLGKLFGTHSQPKYLQLMAVNSPWIYSFNFRGQHFKVEPMNFQILMARDGEARKLNYASAMTSGCASVTRWMAQMAP